MLAVAGRDPTISIYSLASLSPQGTPGSPIATLQADTARINTVMFSPHGTHLLGSSGDGAVIWWNLTPSAAVPYLCQAVRGPGLQPAWNQLASEEHDSIGTLPCASY